MSMTEHPNRILETLHRIEEAHAEITVCIDELRALADQHVPSDVLPDQETPTAVDQPPRHND